MSFSRKIVCINMSRSAHYVETRAEVIRIMAMKRTPSNSKKCACRLLLLLVPLPLLNTTRLKMDGDKCATLKFGVITKSLSAVGPMLGTDRIWSQKFFKYVYIFELINIVKFWYDRIMVSNEYCDLEKSYIDNFMSFLHSVYHCMNMISLKIQISHVEMQIRVI